MSGIYIPGMEMPTSCCECPCSYDNYCAITNDYATFDEWAVSRRENCPLIPVPEHGRLIDADALMLRVDMHGTNKFGMIDEDIREFISAAPTIIPASEEEHP